MDELDLKPQTPSLSTPCLNLHSHLWLLGMVFAATVWEPDVLGRYVSAEESGSIPHPLPHRDWSSLSVAIGTFSYVHYGIQGICPWVWSASWSLSPAVAHCVHWGHCILVQTERKPRTLSYCMLLPRCVVSLGRFRKKPNVFLGAYKWD